MNIILNVLVVTVSVAVASSRGYNPCKDYTHGSHNYLLKDPLDCSRYYSCNGQIGYHMHCAAGTSFDQGFQHGYGSCTGPDPSRVPDCYRQRRSEIQSHYGPWSYWSSCSKTCGSGIRTRSRTCIKKDNFHTYFCNGPSEDREQCYMEECKGTLGQWSHWSGCSATCGSGKHRRTRKCIGPGHCRGLGSLTEIKDCRNLPSCQGKFGKWSPWSPCSATCGEATRQRRRECNGPGDCLGHLEEEEDCLYLPSCKGTLGQWTDWSRCSVTCGKGFQRRTRKCNGPGDCEGLGILEEKATCPELPKCQGTYGEWTDWSQCSSSCYDEGDPNSNIPKVEPKRGRTRKCLGGQYFTCDNLGDRIEVVDCDDCKHCRFNGGSAEYDSGDYKCHF